MKLNIRLLYLYLFSFIGLLVVVMSSVRMLDLGLRVFIFKDADKYEFYTKPVTPEEVINAEEAARSAEVDQKRSRQGEFSNSIAMFAIGLPLYLYHWNLIKKESKTDKSN